MPHTEGSGEPNTEAQMHRNNQINKFNLIDSLQPLHSETKPSYRGHKRRLRFQRAGVTWPVLSGNYMENQRKMVDWKCARGLSDYIKVEFTESLELEVPQSKACVRLRGHLRTWDIFLRTRQTEASEGGCNPSGQEKSVWVTLRLEEGAWWLEVAETKETQWGLPNQRKS